MEERLEPVEITRAGWAQDAELTQLGEKQQSRHPIYNIDYIDEQEEMVQTDENQKDLTTSLDSEDE